MGNSVTRKNFMTTAVVGALGLMGLPGFAQQKVAGETGDAPVSTSPAAGTSRSTSKDNTIQEIIVTATRHSTSLLKTPVAVTAVTQEVLTRAGITDVRGLSGQIPNLQLSTGTDGSSGVQIAIRGVSNSDFTEIGNPAVSLHVGGLYSPRPQGALALLFDLDRLEILRGPQGTLFGRNSTGGSINIIPAKPEFGSSFGSAEVDFGNYNKRQLSVVQNIPVSDNFAMRATFMDNKHDGFINQVQDFYAANIPSKGFVPSRDASGKIIPDVDQRLNKKVSRDKFYTNADEWAGRLSARWKINKDLQVTGSYERYQDNAAGSLAVKDCRSAAGTPYACSPGGQWNQPVAINTPGMTNMSIGTLRAGALWNVNRTTTFEYNFARSDMRREEQQDSDSGYQPLASQVTASLIPFGPTNVFDAHTNPFGFVAGYGSDGMWPVFDNSTFTKASRYLSDVHELQVRGKVDNLRYVAGLFAMHEDNTIDYGQDLQYGNAPWGDPYINFYHQPKRVSDSKAIFAQADWEFRPNWNFTLGGRVTRDSRADVNGQAYLCDAWDGPPHCYYKGEFNPDTADRIHNSADLTGTMGAYYGAAAFAANPGAGFDGIAPTITNASHSWNKSTWRVGLMDQITPNDMVYSSIATGYKAGGFSDLFDLCGGRNCVSPTGVVTPGPQWTNLPYKPETLTNYELGYKGKLLDNHLSLSATLFFSQYKDMQVTGQHNKGRNDAVCPVDQQDCNVVVSWWSTDNVGRADISGLELEGEYLPRAGGHIGYSYSYLNAVVKEYHTFSDDVACQARATSTEPCAAPYPNNGPDASLIYLRPYNVVGNRLPLAPKQSINLSFSQDMSLGDYVLTPRVSLHWQDKMYFSLRNLNDPHLSDSQADYATVDTSIILAAPNGKWHVEAYVRNLTDTISKNSASLGGPGQTFVMASFNDPRMFGVRFGAEW